MCLFASASPVSLFPSNRLRLSDDWFVKWLVYYAKLFSKPFVFQLRDPRMLIWAVKMLS